MADIINFDMPEAEPSIIMVAGVGGGGSNAVNHMYHMGITDVSFMICNTDMQALNRSQIPIRIVLGQSLTQGLGAGNKPEIGRAAAEESYEEILETLKKYGTRMVFVTAGMGGGTGTGAAPVIAKAAKELGILTIAIVTIPFKTEGRKRFSQAMAGIEEIRKYVDSLLIINNENILEIHGDLAISEAFGMADDILTAAAKGIAEIITGDYLINVDFADVQTVMADSGVALMGSARAGGENRADDAVRNALASPLLNHRDISGAKNILVNITHGTKEPTLRETHYITEFVQEQTGYVADLIWGEGKDESLGDEIQVTIIATGFDADVVNGFFEETKSGGTQILNMQQAAAERKREQAGAMAEADQPIEDESVEAEPAVEPMVAPEPIQKPVTEEPKPSYPRIEPDRPYQTRRGFVPPAAPQEQSPFQSRQAVGRTTIVAGTDNEGYVVVEQTPIPAPKAEAEETINYDELEKRPAWLRRNMSFEEGASDDKAVSRVTLKDDSAANRQPEQPTNALFD